MGLLTWLGLTEAPATPQTRDAGSGTTPPARSESARLVTAGDAFSISMVYRAIQIHAISVKQLSMDVVRDGSAMVRTPAIVRQPDVNETRSAFLEMTVVSLACNGNAYWKITRDDSGRVTNLEALNPIDVRVLVDKAGKTTGYTYGARDASNPYAPNEIKHLKLLRVPGSPYGLGPIQAAQIELRGAIDLRDYASNWFVESGVPNGVLKSDQVLSTDQATQAKDAWNSSQGAKKGVAVLGNGLSYAPVYLSPADAQFLESQQFTVTQIARLFGVPSSLMLAAVEGNTQTYQNVEQDWIGYLRFSLMAYLVEIEDALTVLIPRGQKVKFNVEALLRSDTTTRYAAHAAGLLAGFLTINEVREWEGLPPITPTPAPAPEEQS